MSQSLIEVFELAECHQLEVNAGLVEPDAPGINTLSYDILPPLTPLFVVSDMIYIAEPDEEGASVVKEPYRYPFATGGYLGFSWSIERLKHDSNDINRLVLGALTRNIQNETVLWTPVESIDVWDVNDELKDVVLAQDILDIAKLPNSCRNLHEFLSLCERIPDSDETVSNLYLALINSVVKPEELFTSVNSPGCSEEFEKYRYSWGKNIVALTSYSVRKGDIFAFADLDGRRRLVISRRFSNTRIHEKNIFVSSEYGFERAD